MSSSVNVVVCGAHMSGLPLNHQLTELGGQLVTKTLTAPSYRLFKLDCFSPPRPGLLRVATGGASIEVEVWSLPLAQYGAFVAGVPGPLGFGSLLLTDGMVAQGFLCEAYATENAQDITHLGSWRNFLKQ
jgi:allophanate hydrolase